VQAVEACVPSGSKVARSLADAAYLKLFDAIYDWLTALDTAPKEKYKYIAKMGAYGVRMERPVSDLFCECGRKLSPLVHRAVSVANSVYCSSRQASRKGFQ
jgi:hypothetical protein